MVGAYWDKAKRSGRFFVLPLLFELRFCNWRLIESGRRFCGGGFF